MNNSNAVEARRLKRLGLREIRSSRSALSVVSASVLLVALLWMALELVLSATGYPALLMAPAELARRTASVATATVPTALVAAGAAMALAGLGLLAAACLPGTKARHIVDHARTAVVVDSEVLAAAASRTARTAARLAPEQVTSRVGRRRIDVTLNPASGRAVDVDAVRDAVERETAACGLRTPLAVRVATDNQVVGA